METSTRMFEFDTGNGIDIVDITPALKSHLATSNVTQGVMLVTSRHTTTAIIINEYESRLLDDMRKFLSDLVPHNNKYRHNDIALRDCPPDEPENAHSHLMALLMGSSESIPVVNGELALGQYQSVMLLELDGPRARTVSVQLLGN